MKMAEVVLARGDRSTYPRLVQIYGPFSAGEVLTPEECERMLLSHSEKSVSGIRNRAIIALLWRCGLRQSELVALRPGDIDPTMATLLVMNSDGTGRKLPLKVQTHVILTEWEGERRKLRGKQLGINERQPLFCTIEKNNFGQPLSGSYLRGMLSRTAKKAGIGKQIHAEAFRDALAMELRQAGYGMGVVARFLGG